MFTALGDNRKLKISEILQMFYQMMNANLLIVKEQNIIQTKKNNKNKITFTNIKDYDVKICISTDDITNALKDEKLLEKFLYQF